MRWLIPLLALPCAVPVLAQSSLFGETENEQVLKTERACVMSSYSLAARMTVHAVDGTGQVLFALDVVEPPSPGHAKEDSRTIRALGGDNDDRLYGRMRFMIAATSDGGSRYSAILPRDFLTFLADRRTEQLIIEDAGGNVLKVPVRGTRADAVALLQKCSESL